MKILKNWDNKTWLSSSKYVSSMISFLEKKIKFNKKIEILDIGCGRGKIISTLSKKYQMDSLPIGIDIVDHKSTSKKIEFIKINALKYLNKTKKNFDLILYKQSIHFFKNAEIKKILNYSKKKLKPKGKIIILALCPKENYWPLFKNFKTQLLKSLRRDEIILRSIKLNLRNYKINYFKFQVKISRKEYLHMVKNRFTSCLLKFSNKELKYGIEEISKRYKKKLIFYDKLISISFEKK